MVVRGPSALKLRREISGILGNMRVPMFNLRKYLICSQTLARDDYRCLVTGKVEGWASDYKYVSFSRNTCNTGSEPPVILTRVRPDFEFIRELPKDVAGSKIPWFKIRSQNRQTSPAS